MTSAHNPYFKVTILCTFWFLNYHNTGRTDATLAQLKAVPHSCCKTWHPFAPLLRTEDS
ncbi:hypothetical protein EVA_09195 [gut metagenome]|uniref:Uncharacterized protein n=1 Tax=gut metagenome TaxID=749906 RepID=J9GRF2_9ZZZZ